MQKCRVFCKKQIFSNTPKPSGLRHKEVVSKTPIYVGGLFVFDIKKDCEVIEYSKSVRLKAETLAHRLNTFGGTCDHNSDPCTRLKSKTSLFCFNLGVNEAVQPPKMP